MPNWLSTAAEMLWRGKATPGTERMKRNTAATQQKKGVRETVRTPRKINRPRRDTVFQLAAVFGKPYREHPDPDAPDSAALRVVTSDSDA